MKILHLDTNHPLLIQQLNELGFTNHEDYSSTKSDIEKKIDDYNGIVIRSRFKIDKEFLDKAKNIKFIARVGAGLENIDVDYAESKGIKLIAAPEGNRNAVAEHTLAMLLTLFHKLHKANDEVKNGLWNREANRGIELDGKTVGLIGYGNMGKAFAKILSGFNVEVICYDIKDDVGDINARQVPLKELQERTDVLSLHTPETPLTIGMVNKSFIAKFKNPFWLINTARGKSVVTSDLVEALKKGKILGAGLDVLEYEKSSFENLFSEKTIVQSTRAESGEIQFGEESRDTSIEDFKFLIQSENVLLTPHVAGWTVESKIKLAQAIVDKITMNFS